jgi:CspA family cold shock protein
MSQAVGVQPKANASAENAPDGVFRGTVVWFSNKRGFGFIRPDAGGKDLFVHFTGIDSDRGHRKLLAGQRVEYIVSLGDRGPFASQVRVLDTAR